MTSREYSARSQECLSCTWPIAFPYLTVSEGAPPLIAQKRRGSRFHNLFITLCAGLSGRAGPGKMTQTETQEDLCTPHPPPPPTFIRNTGLQLVPKGCLQCRSRCEGKSKKSENKRPGPPIYSLKVRECQLQGTENSVARPAEQTWVDLLGKNQSRSPGEE